MKLMKRVARRVALSLSESKRFTILNETPLGTSTSQTRWAYKNIFAQLPTATGTLAGVSFALEGNEVVDLLAKTKIVVEIPWGNILLDNSAAGAYGTVYVHAMIVQANDFSQQGSGGPPPGSLTWTNYPAQYSAGDPGWFLNQDGNRPTLNGNNVRIIKRFSRKVTPPAQMDLQSGTVVVVARGRQMVNITMKHKFKGKKTFEDFPLGDLDSNFPRSGVLRGSNYYWLVGYQLTGALSTVAGSPVMAMDQYLYFKDP